MGGEEGKERGRRGRDNKSAAERSRVVQHKPPSLAVGFQRKPAEKAEANEIREQKWQSGVG